MANIAGNTNQLGVIPVKTTGQPTRPGKVTRGPAGNKPRIHLVSSKGSVPAIIYAEAIAQRQKNKAVNPIVNTHPELASESDSGKMSEPVSGGNPKLRENQLKNPAGVAKRPAPKHQNNPAFAGSFTSAGKAWALKQNAMSKT